MTRRGYVALALAALVVLVVPLGLVPLIRAQGDPAPPRSVDDSYRIDGDLTCDSDVKEAPAVPLEAEPVAMLVCVAPDTPMPWTPPADVVVDGLGALMDQLGDLEPTPNGPFDCPFDAGPDYVLVFRLLGQRVVSIGGQTAGCRTISAGDSSWFGGDEVMSTVVDLVARQRSSTRAPDARPDAPSCLIPPDGQVALSLTGDVREMVSATSCWVDGIKADAPVNDPVEVSPGDLARLMRDLRRNTEPVEVFGDVECPGGRSGYFRQWLVGRTAWGDLVQLSGACHEFAVVPQTQTAEQGRALHWVASPRSQRILDRLRR